MFRILYLKMLNAQILLTKAIQGIKPRERSPPKRERLSPDRYLNLAKRGGKAPLSLVQAAWLSKR